ncbi:UDP-N-acetylmuramoyl-L-alanyl-D-glutamate--2,6-diaminopimelate ligase [Paenibacillus naphthalenovorans]|uniref:UDP-N-acetylmuramoyl-L-alanyl-D-glutamate--2,6-diaminopimelate ligase n=1 Tax=Paenibacillus naphthalenovorans TaxID=162209 RepID=A0A0U2W1H8_9BACL|nr:UDP-N-acetylmuramoyl-L-alanyl-D-glutamate--2,6-diaminopimelate ligase [Paenibacillus naphthalenovorans]ALS21365.1 UDP-N-acetylmuramoylalanyl-D-glutamate--2,6-diaminopimelate ligase [Paenibacillus naphthalenovorans]GCL72624.1 UDP-N-acetylmuramoyl-L-alanyl-D-glutamate--2, 6-diaminopimelate ligase [Paenibacillus naphthalenovorans]SDH95475.1 UDP-N-acetylmuramoyl-L-alanyl-D-glutamate--2,6-diaminopimelate ligase [Paenibacillus naphthalenovorans]
MQLKELASQLAVSRLVGDDRINITGLQTDSRKVNPGDLFICIPGFAVDGHDYAGKAVERGAVALVAEREMELGVPVLIVKDARYAMAVLANHYYGYPSRELKLIGITGTNGKTTTTYLLEKILSDQGFRTGLMGNIHVKIGSRYIPNAMTNTQEAVELQRILREMVNEGTDYCIMEASSHGLELGRVKGCRFRTGIFTNLTQDHLDFHHTMEQYKAAKGLLFSRLGNEFSDDPNQSRFAVLNADDPASKDYARLTAAQIITYGIEDPSADVRAEAIEISSKGTRFKCVTFRGSAEVSMRLVGRFNVYNALAAIACALAEGIELARIADSLGRVDSVEGRMEIVNAGQEFLVLVDYAHTPDGLENALSTIRQFAEGKVYCVFGCGGDRDRAKRPLMGGVAAKYADYVFVTSDNPRTENPERILQDIVPGLRTAGYDPGRYELVADRREAIQKAVDRAAPGDCILIAGKGHETYQDIMGVKHPFDDRKVAKEAIMNRFRSSGSDGV